MSHLWAFLATMSVVLMIVGPVLWWAVSSAVRDTKKHRRVELVAEFEREQQQQVRIDRYEQHNTATHPFTRKP